jgi:hypothetical protein
LGQHYFGNGQALFITVPDTLKDSLQTCHSELEHKVHKHFWLSQYLYDQRLVKSNLKMPLLPEQELRLYA